MTRLFMHEDLAGFFEAEPALTVGDACLVLKIQVSLGFTGKNPHVLLRLDLRFASRIKAINWPLRTALIFMPLINGHLRAYK